VNRAGKKNLVDTANLRQNEEKFIGKKASVPARAKEEAKQKKIVFLDKNLGRKDGGTEKEKLGKDRSAGKDRKGNRTYQFKRGEKKPVESRKKGALDDLGLV